TEPAADEAENTRRRKATAAGKRCGNVRPASTPAPAGWRRGAFPPTAVGGEHVHPSGAARFLAFPPQQRGGGGFGRKRRHRTAAAGRLAFVDAVRDHPAGPAAAPASASCRPFGPSLPGL